MSDSIAEVGGKPYLVFLPPGKTLLDGRLVIPSSGFCEAGDVEVFIHNLWS